MSLSPFHLAIPVSSLENARQFYGELLGCSEGRSSQQWIDWNLFGHQLVTHQVSTMPSRSPSNSVDAKEVPIPHFGVVLDMHSWQVLADKLIAAKVNFVIEPYIRFRGQVGEQATLFLLDYCGNALEFKGFSDIERLFDAG